MERPTFDQPNGIRVAAVGLDVVNENNVLSGMLPVRPAGSQTIIALDVSLLNVLMLLVSVGVVERDVSCKQHHPTDECTHRKSLRR